MKIDDLAKKAVICISLVGLLLNCTKKTEDEKINNRTFDEDLDSDLSGFKSPEAFHLGINHTAKEYSILNDWDLAYKNQKNPDINYPVCIFGDNQHSLEGQAVVANLSIAATQWVKLLEGYLDWKVNSVTFYKSTKGCDLVNGLRVLTVHSDTRVGENAYTYSSAFQIFVGPEHFSGLEVLVHELGHQIGLADVWVETITGQTRSIMDGDPKNKSEGFSNDDKSAIKHVWARIKEKEVESGCPADYILAKSTDNAVYCVPIDKQNAEAEIAPMPTDAADATDATGTTGTTDTTDTTDTTGTTDTNDTIVSNQGASESENNNDLELVDHDRDIVKFGV